MEQRSGRHGLLDTLDTTLQEHEQKSGHAIHGTDRVTAATFGLSVQVVEQQWPHEGVTRKCTIRTLNAPFTNIDIFACMLYLSVQAGCQVFAAWPLSPCTTALFMGWAHVLQYALQHPTSPDSICSFLNPSGPPGECLVCLCACVHVFQVCSYPVRSCLSCLVCRAVVPQPALSYPEHPSAICRHLFSKLQTPTGQTRLSPFFLLSFLLRAVLLLHFPLKTHNTIHSSRTLANSQIFSPRYEQAIFYHLRPCVPTPALLVYLSAPSKVVPCVTPLSLHLPTFRPWVAR
ncbi:hypothetical protein VFPPC_16436 [Pochonia chlamydosporia 170]|uniref:Uncharacterized protein n=1 Tax=Pochonia chlamydosporia 170 TaxID=1380566 RepID=A0A179FDK1_METCM|nr:hypothetical protein VFPPC_16436 [Pochonia chlamydosporia 170]OAQ63189.1 hypothetical protein VFPPC_16436 [Pochonia chlamydosporia 170]